ncbi:hypothetical protein TA3x_000025 [Tundrisphaera sp. TA3]|uniref:hypothetical protein n=1 Tax=Tundrisphaera sp. TA3 TaxID=3435775 RepID=UPI003EC03D86
MLLFIAVALLAEIAHAVDGEAPPADGKELEVAHGLLLQAKRILDAKYRANPMGGSRYTDGVAAALAEVGDRDAAEATFSHLPLGDRFGNVRLRTLAVGYARGGNLERARQTINRIRDAEPGYANQRLLAWREAGRALAKLGRTREAAEAFAEAVRSIAGRDDRPWSEAAPLSEIAEAQHAIGRADESSATFEMAVSLALADPDESLLRISLSNIAAAQARAGYLPQALATVDRIGDPEHRWWAWYGIVEAEANSGRLDEAYRIAERVEGKAVPKTWMALADAQAKRGHRPEAGRALEKAEAAVRPIAEIGYRIQMVLLLAESRASLGDRSAAEAWLRQATEIAEGAVVVEGGPFALLRRIEQAPGAVHREFNLCAIAMTQAKLGFTDAAGGTFDRAKVAAEGQRAGLWRDSAFRSLAEVQAKSGFPDDAIRTLAAIPTTERGWLAYAPIAAAKARAGDLEGAERVAGLHAGDATSTRFYIAQALLEAGDPKNALRVGLRAASLVEEVLHDAARRLSESGDVARVTDAVAQAYEEDRVALLLGAAEGLFERSGRRAKGAAAAASAPSK